MKRSGPDPVRNVYIMEFAGARIEILDHTDPTLIGIKGKVKKETMGTFLIVSDGKEKMVQKKGGRFQVVVMTKEGSRPVTIIGDDIMFRPVDRTKKCERKRPPENNNDRKQRS